MSDNINTLKNLLSKGLYLNNLDDMRRLCDALMEEMEEPLPLYVLSSIFDGIYSSWDDRRVTVEEADQTEASLLPHLKKVATLIEASGDKDKLWSALNDLVKAYAHC